MTRVVAALSSVVFALLYAQPLRAETSAPQIHLQSCVVRVGFAGDLNSIAGDMRVRFVNDSDQTLTTIVWRATTDAGTMHFTDNGTFSPHVSIYRRPQYRGPRFHKETRPVPLMQMGPGVCSVVSTVNAAGEVWERPGIAPPAMTIPALRAADAPPVPATFDNPDHNPIGIIACQFDLFFDRSYGNVRFRNLSSRQIDSVTFRGLFGAAGVDYVNRGRFAPGVTVRAELRRRGDLPPNAYQEFTTLDQPTSCVAVSAHYADGETWQNPSVSRTEPPFPVGVP